MIYAIVIIICSIVLSALFSGLETGTYTINKIRVHHHIQQNKKRAALLANNLKDPQLFIFMTLIGNNICVYLATGSVTEIFSHYHIGGNELKMVYGFIPWSAEIAATMTLMLPLFIFAEVGPKNLFRVKADPLMYETAGVQYVLLTICRPITVPLKMFTELLTRSSKCTYSSGIRNINLQRLRLFIKESRDEGTINERQSKMIDNTLMLQKKMAIDVMTPIKDVVALSINEVTTENCITIFKHNKDNNIPVYDGDSTNITHYLDLFDLISVSMDNKKELKNELKDIFYIYDQSDLQQAFYQLQTNGAEIAAVKNDLEHIIGVVRLNDIVRTITGQNE